MFSRTTLPNGCTYSVIPYLNTAIASVNLWIRREGRFDLDHLCEHLIAYKLKRICKGKFPAVIGAKTTQDGYCLFARLPNKFIGEFIELAVSCFALDNQFINQKRVDEELAAISNELSSLSPKSKKINLDLGETPEHILNELTLDLVRSRLRQLLNGKRWLCSGQLKLATVLELSQYKRSDSLGVNPPLY
ncbi:integrase [Vibrio cholerae]|nr:integrase [Vibrio cholerae]